MYYYGKNTIKGLIDSKTSLEVVYLNHKFNDKEILNLLKRNNIYYEFVDKEYLDKLSDNSNHQGIVVKTFKYEYKDLKSIVEKNKNNENALILILDGLEDPQNFGSIIRTSEALLVSGIIIPKNRSVKVTPSVARVSTGAINLVDIALVTNINQSIKYLKENNYWIVGADMNTDLLYDQVDYKMKIGLVIGSEGKGISAQTKKECDFLVKIPMYGKISSLNAAISSAIIMYAINSNRTK